MCAIAGNQMKHRAEHMLKKMAHRAPNGSKVVADGRFSMGMGRLAVLDLTSENLCPHVDGKLVLSFNGEIYNYLELRTKLQKLGHTFTTTSDTEVVMKAYKQWGKDMLERFNGMFALAIYDGKRVFLARDIAGEKPLYYRTHPFEFASEAKALKWRCQELPPAHYLIYDFDRKEVLECNRWWSLSLHYIDPATAEQELETLLEDAIRLRTRADVPIALYYSGGIDSSLIRSFHTFNYELTYTDGDYQEEFLKLFPKLLWHLDYPVHSFSAFGLYKLAEQVSRTPARVVLSGEGADELFGGYVRYIPHTIDQEARRHFPSYPTYFPRARDLNSILWEDFTGNLRELLRMGDRMASAWGIENRCPFLDKRIIEFAFSLPQEMKIQGFDTKRILRRILERRVPSYRHIEKVGLYCAVNKWLDVSNPFSKEKYVALQETYLSEYMDGALFEDIP